MSNRYRRDQELNNRISRTILTDPVTAKRFQADPATRLQLEVLRNVLLLADKAMEAEGINHETRDRVAHWILFGEPPPSWEDDPDARIDIAVRDQIAQDAIRKAQLAEPVQPFLRPDYIAAPVNGAPGEPITMMRREGGA